MKETDSTRVGTTQMALSYALITNSLMSEPCSGDCARDKLMCMKNPPPQPGPASGDSTSKVTLTESFSFPYSLPSAVPFFLRALVKQSPLGNPLSLTSLVWDLHCPNQIFEQEDFQSTFSQIPKVVQQLYGV